MDDAAAQDIARTLREHPLLPAIAAELFVERMEGVRISEEARFPVRFDRKRDTIASAIRLVGLNADRAGTIRAVLVRSALPVAGDTGLPKHHEDVREALRCSLRAALPTATAAGTRAGWDDVADIVAGSLFGAPLVADRSAAAA